jgi:hypothetical protein
MTTQMQTQSLMLRDDAGNVYLLSPAQVQAARVPAEKVKELRKALDGQDVAGYLFDIGNVTNIAALGQQNNQNVTNLVAGFFVNANQTGLAIGSNAGAINQSR